MRFDEYGKTILSSEELFNLILEQRFEEGLVVEDGAAAAQYNEQCLLNDKKKFQLDVPVDEGCPVEYHKKRSQEWLIPEPFASLDVREYLYDLCETEEQVSRVIEEMELYEQKELTNLLRLLIYLVDHFRKNNVVWGVGRGSSVASYVLYLIGIIKIDPLKFGLDVREFLR